MNITINNRVIQLEKPTSILGAICQAGARLQSPDCGSARQWTRHPLCPAITLAEVDGMLLSGALLGRRPAGDGMTIMTSSPTIDKALAERAKMLQDCHECFFVREMQKVLAADAESAGFINLEEWEKFDFPLRTVEPSLIHDPNRCVRCRSCVEVCRDVQTVEALRFDEKQGVLIDDRRCVRCGQCIHVCPSGAISKYRKLIEFLGCHSCPFDKPLGAMREKDETKKAWAILHDRDCHPVAQFAPAVRASLAQEFCMEPGELVTGKLYAALRRLGFKQVWDTNFAADLTIMEEGSELLQRIATAGKLPMLTSCSPGWVRFAETFFPDLLPHLSTAKSPQQMLGAVAKTFAAPRLKIDPSRMKVVSFMPCTAKKAEAARPEMNSAFRFHQAHGGGSAAESYPDVDLVLTTRELVRLLKMAGLDLRCMPEEAADPLLGAYTGAAPIFGRTGGVMEAALRTAAVLLAGAPFARLEFHALETMDGVKTAAVQVGTVTLKIAVVHGLGNVRKVCESIRSGGDFASYHFIEFMACPGGCIGGGGQPIPTNLYAKGARMAGLNKDDREMHALRMSHENPEVKTLYEIFLEKPLSYISHSLLHTHYTDRSPASAGPIP
ncbi:MAG: [FeFe] hydrogenase, group A [Verrucomicrobiae bacterium]|nr:[FeFe] hydrogenase, group A [Verrucomicrobiae bacterium]